MKGSRPIKFDVLRIPVLSLERAQELVQGQHRPKPKARLLFAIRQFSERTREMLRTSGCSWAEELTGFVHIVGPGLLVNMNCSSKSERRPESAVAGSFWIIGGSPIDLQPEGQNQPSDES